MKGFGEYRGHSPHPLTGCEAGPTTHRRGPGGRKGHRAKQLPPGKWKEAGICGECFLEGQGGSGVALSAERLPSARLGGRNSQSQHASMPAEEMLDRNTPVFGLSPGRSDAGSMLLPGP